ncbi:thioredoxin family protein [Hyphobacterium sp.]|uniref:thioredoxin family protein n=1 Tax=Hyphobacterium sp. TaxID=2004662 RepID=UPI003B5280E4
MIRYLLLFWLAFIPAALADDGHPEPFVAEADARAEMAAALERAAVDDKRVILVFGANWCHDSRGLADHFRQEDLQAVLAEHYEVIWIDVGWRHRNLDIARDYGVPTIYGTPTVLIVDPELGLINRGTMHSWHTAYSREHDVVVRYFRQFAFSTPGGGVVENTAAYAALVADIEAWEAREGARLTAAYIQSRRWRESLDAEYGRRESDISSAEFYRAYNAVEAQIDQHRGRMRQDRSDLYTEARRAVRNAMLDAGISLSPAGAQEFDATDPEIVLDFPDYSGLAFPWESEGWTL